MSPNVQSVQFQLQQSERITVMDLRKVTIKKRAANLCWMRSSLLASVDVIKFQATDTYSSLGWENDVEVSLD
jgi:hypothetical protein